ncbi:DNA sulfur modification protein DndD [Rhizobium sp. YTUHZ044]|uniref:DNA sulfur modification protein DndD n=1 Tax=Rhizobium sp. YTUHZ044 TaxID=2962678 RepID=UPI003DA8D392
MYFKNISLRDWKAYTVANFDFPAPTPEKNIILVGAPNGFGKTSLFEAIVLGLFGRSGLPLVARSPFASDDKERLATSYKTFLEKALHRGAVEAGRTSCSVKMTFVDDDSQEIEIHRIWYFSDKGAFRPQDEEVRVYEGSTRRLIGPSPNEDVDEIEWYRDFIAKRFLPYYLAAFFLFDGEQVSAFAEREMAVQVRSGIEGLLGIPVLRDLAADLRQYARVRRSEVNNVSDKTLERLELDIDTAQFQVNEKKQRLAELEPEHQTMKEQREKLTRELASFGVGSQAQFQEQFERLNRFEREIEEGRAQLEALLSQDIALALSGAKLRSALKETLVGEIAREKWLAGRQQGDANLDRYLSAVEAALNLIQPDLMHTQKSSVLKVSRDAWETLWNPPPTNIVENVLHKYLNELDRIRVSERLDELDQVGAPEIVDLLDRISATEEAHGRLQQEITKTEAIAPNVDKKRLELGAVNGRLQELDQEIGALRREIGVTDAEITKRNTELARLSGQWDQAKPNLRRASRALTAASMIDAIVSKAVPSQIAAIATAMTAAHKSMAHKKDLVERIEITEDCEVKLLSADGIDLRNFDLSAGEKQIFTQALISAVASVSQRSFPMVIDTPLGRLDVEHRKGVLQHLIRPDHQVILLSTNTEIVGEYHEVVSDHVQKEFLIQFERVGDIGQSSVHEGYFRSPQVRAS